MTGERANTLSRLRELGAILLAPRQTVSLFGGDTARAAFENLTKRHPRFPLVPAKKYGVSLLDLSQRYEDYMAGGERKYCRYMLRRAVKLGFTFGPFEIATFIGDLMEVNGSAAHRQNKSMSPDYLDRAKVMEFHRHKGENWGVFDSQGRLRAYAVVPVPGQAAFLSRLLGHADDLEDGIMFLLVAEIVRMLIAKRAECGNPRWLCYDTYYGASEGLRPFKRRLGFSPMVVNWQWMPEP